MASICHLGPSWYKFEIFSLNVNMIENEFVNFLAGTGKTFTIVESVLQLVNRFADCRIMYTEQLSGGSSGWASGSGGLANRGKDAWRVCNANGQVVRRRCLNRRGSLIKSQFHESLSSAILRKSGKTDVNSLQLVMFSLPLLSLFIIPVWFCAIGILLCHFFSETYYIINFDIVYCTVISKH